MNKTLLRRMSVKGGMVDAVGTHKLAKPAVVMSALSGRVLGRFL